MRNSRRSGKSPSGWPLGRLSVSVDAETCSRSLRTYAAESWHIIEPGTPYAAGWHSDCIFEYLEAVTAGHIKRLLINMPPRSGKTSNVAVAWPTWEWTRNPKERWIFTSYAASLSEDASLKRRQILESDWYRERWPGVVLARDRNERCEQHNTNRGVLISTSRDGTITGKGGNRIVIDDLQNPKLAYSAAERDAADRYFNRTLPTRLNSQREGVMVCVMQRLHEKDIAARCKELGWTTLILPGQARRPTTITFPRSGRVKTMAEGECMWPEREDASTHEKLRESMGEWEYAAQITQEPAPADGGKFKRIHFRYWDTAGEGLLRLHGQVEEIVALADCRVFLTSDLATSTRQLADYTVVSVWAVTPRGQLILLDRVRERMEAPDTLATIIRLYAQWKAQYIAVEANGMQLSFAQHLSAAGVAVRAITTVPDKVTNSVTAQIRVQAHQVFFPMMADWLPEWELELLLFPKGHDDQVDTLSSAANEVFVAGAAEQPEAERLAEEAKKAAALLEQRRAEWMNEDNEALWQ